MFVCFWCDEHENPLNRIWDTHQRLNISLIVVLLWNDKNEKVKKRRKEIELSSGNIQLHFHDNYIAETSTTSWWLRNQHECLQKHIYFFTYSYENVIWKYTEKRWMDNKNGVWEFQRVFISRLNRQKDKSNIWNGNNADDIFKCSGVNVAIKANIYRKKGGHKNVRNAAFVERRRTEKKNPNKNTYWIESVSQNTELGPWVYAWLYTSISHRYTSKNGSRFTHKRTS